MLPGISSKLITETQEWCSWPFIQISIKKTVANTCSKLRKKNQPQQSNVLMF